MGVATTLHFSGPKGTPGGRRAYTRELEDSLTPCGRLAAGARGAGGGQPPPSDWGGAFYSLAERRPTRWLSSANASRRSLINSLLRPAERNSDCPVRRALTCRQGGGMQSRLCQQQQPVAEDEGGIAEGLGQRLETSFVTRAIVLRNWQSRA